MARRESPVGRRLHDLVWLYAAYAANMALPLVILPILGRRLGVEGWGRAAFAQAFAQYLTLVIDYGFSLSATRAVAQHRDRAERLAELLAAVNTAKAAMAIVVVAVGVGIGLWLPMFRDQPACLVAGTALGVVQGASLAWFFQGLERQRFVAGLEVVARLIAAVAIVVLIRDANDAWMVPGFQAIGQLVTVCIAGLVAGRLVGWRRVERGSVLAVVREGLSLFGFRCATSLYAVGNTFLLGLFAPPAIVGQYAAAERIAGAARGTFGPVNQLLFPRMSHLIGTDRAAATRLARFGFVGLVSLAMAGGTVLAIFADGILTLLMGPAFRPAVPMLRVLCLTLPLIAANNILGLQWMLPLKLDAPFLTIIVAASVTNLALALWLATAHGGMGMAWAVVCAETLVTGGMLVYLMSRRRDPFRSPEWVAGAEIPR